MAAEGDLGAPEARGTLGTVRNAVLLLELLSEGPAYQPLTDLADRSGLSVPTVHRLLRSLVLADLVVQDPQSSRYGLGPELTRLSHRYLTRLPILGALAPYLIPLRDTVRATIELAILVRGSVVYVDRVDGDEGGLYRQAHRVADVLLTAAGRVLAAHADDAAWELAMSGAPADLQAQAKRDRDAWAKASYLVTATESIGAPTEVAVPVLNAQGEAVAALAATLPAEATPDRIATAAAHLSRAATAAGRTLGHA